MHRPIYADAKLSIPPVRQYLSYTKSDCFTRRKNHRILFYIVGLPCILDRE